MITAYFTFVTVACFVAIIVSAVSTVATARVFA